ncbi:MAG: flagellar basal body P-ring protein FlgI [Candidatus Kapabacteria bacterium]|nr:flagellar basal body P-ring protein FlgI [Candidatus Kapabacteria bacterium]
MKYIKNILKKSSKLITISLLVLLICVNNVFSSRIKDIAVVQGASGVQVIGYGLVTGLNQTGDNQMTGIAVQSVVNMLKRFGLTVPQTNPRVRNVAAVMVTTTIPSFMKRGSKIDIQVSSIGDATSLQGGVLLMTPISTSEGIILGMAQGAVSVGGYDFQSMGSRLGRNFVTTGRVPSGLILEKDIEGKIIENQIVKFVLRDPDFTSANRVALAINASVGMANSATVIDAGSIDVKIPTAYSQTQLMQTISNIESLLVQTDPVARVVINERTGTIVIGGKVQLLPVVISHGGLEISIQKNVIVPQPAPFTIRPPSPVETANIQANEETNPAIAIKGVMGAPAKAVEPTVDDLASALNSLQVKPRDLIAIFQALKEAGSLQGELIIQ